MQGGVTAITSPSRRRGQYAPEFRGLPRLMDREMAMKRKLVSSVAALALVLSSSPTLAEDAADPLAASKAQTEATKAETERLKAQTELVKAQSDALGLPKFEGTTELKDNAGQMESWILSAETVDAAALNISAQVKDKAKGRFVLVVGKEETWNFSLPASLVAEMAALTRSLDTVRVADGCERPKQKKETGTPRSRRGGGRGARTSSSASGDKGATTAAAVPTIADSALPLAGAVLSALKGNTTISGISLSPGSQLLNDTVAGKLSAQAGYNIQAITPSELTDAGDVAKSAVGQAWDKLVLAREAALTCRAKISPFGDQDAVKGRIAVLDGAIASADAFAARAALSADDKPSLLVRAMLIDILAAKKPLVLRVNIEQAGGSLLKRDSLASALGFSGVRLTGGLIVSYRLSDPTTGVVGAGGVMVCRTTYASMKDIQKGRTPAPECGATVGGIKAAARLP